MTNLNQRRLIAFLLHQPGLTLLCGDRPSTAMLVSNAVALALTVAATLAVWILVENATLQQLLTTWAVGHFAWSVVLTIAQSRAKSGESGHGLG